ncbi:TonB-dependent receptor [Mucilaginibacter sp. JRF]|uniref:TonB-dependent receptor n=1 Tax=Mucilaginibacter sp. JRF TaxID=2780088 RepID=UPI0018829C8B|nr:TonB-dependent receptor [Mucilaginibacter sp. JRF]MBE9583235.1 TonB-dependent receptor [Mucilaginibacter sp. JRF]
MKLTTILLVIFTLGVRANSRAQQVTLSLNNSTLKVFLTEVEKQTGYEFLYNDELLRKYNNISLNIKNASVEQALDQAFSGKPLYYKFRDKTITILERRSPRQNPNADFTLTGVVADRNGNPIPGVNVKVENTNNGTATDYTGKFSLKNIKVNDVIFISALSYLTQRVVIGNQTELRITLLEDNKGLDEVVVVGQGVQKKASVIGAISSVSTKELSQSPVSNISNALAGRLPGLISIQRSGMQGNDDAQLLIRGVATLNGSGPMVVVDGVEGRTMADIEPSDIESVSILKDATATAIYGIRGANGVVLITSRRGSSSKAPAITVTSQYGLQSPTRVPDVVNSYEYATLYNQANKNNGQPLTYTEEQLEGYRNHTDPYLYPDNDFASILLKKRSAMTRTNLTVTGGSNFARFFVSAGYLSQDGIYKTYPTPYPSDQVAKRYNFRGNLDVNVTNTTILRLDLSGSFGSVNRPRYSNEPFFSIVRVPPNLAPIKNPDGSWGAATSLGVNPVAELSDVGYVVSYIGRSQGTFALTQKLDMITKGLSATLSLSYDANYYQDQQRGKSYDSFHYNPDGSYTRVGTGSKLGTVAGSYGLSRFSTYRATLAYDRTFGSNAITSSMIFTQQKSYNNIEIPAAVQGFSGRTTYNYKFKYFAEATYAYNGSENFAPGKRYGFFPAGAIGWIASEEPFIKEHAKFISFLKLRASFGVVGNDQIGGSRFLFNSYYADAGGSSFGNPPSGANGLREAFLGNRNITWERGYKRNIAFESKYFSDLITLNVDLFRENRKQILVSSLVPDAAGLPNFPPINKGEVRNQGFEAELGIRKKFRSLMVNLRGNMGFNNSKVLDNNEATPLYGYQTGVGKRVYQPLGLISEGFFQNADEITNSPTQTYSSRIIPGDIKYRDVNGDGIVNDFDRVAIGYSTIPEIQYGITLDMSYKNFDLSVLFQGSAHSSVYFDEFGYVPFDRQGTALREQLNSWTPETAATATYPRIDIGANANNTRLSTFTQQNGDYLRLKNAEIGYTFSQDLLKKVGLKKVRVFANGQNLLTWSEIKFVDPEYGSGGIGNTYPQQKVYNFGIRLDF